MDSRTETVYEVFVRRGDGTARSTINAGASREHADAIAKRNLYLLREHPDWAIVIAKTTMVTSSSYTEDVYAGPVKVTP